MHLELRHLRTIRAIHDQGGLARAAEVLNITQSALSHQVRALEDQAGTSLFLRQTKPMRLSPAGLRLLAVARQVLPLVEAAESEMRGVTQGKLGRLHIAMECHACFNWLLPALDAFRHDWPGVDIDVRAGLAFTALPALVRGDADMVISSDPEDLPGIVFEPLFDYNPLLVVPARHPLAGRDFAEPADLSAETLITYPMDRARLDVFSHFLDPAGVQPGAVREIELTDVILLLVASGRGVSVLPDWVLEREAGNPELVTLPLGRRGVVRRLYAAVREADRDLAFMGDMIRLAREGRNAG
ncbi:LysR family transcriptional regulator [Paracoccus sp. MC1862]|uniref:LysR family transcriptional regulator n=1 Tax=Paracoccus sp. MC1862 TaxID=2760307 RepID=UPI0016043C76|nr:LysR family transcriptional regulator [Paracoccus sp. MC1862]MBB1497599.1 LysR family transcriptional regulator [Paracoccus sp. MC1862]QQO44046.1 LysR family transcriptional regulator [Paracoccus sp. MC1862]